MKMPERKLTEGSNAFWVVLSLALVLQGCAQRQRAETLATANARTTAKEASESVGPKLVEAPAPVASEAISQPVTDAATDAAPEMVLIKGGKFAMGSDDGMPEESPVHEVAVNSFLMDRHEVTVGEFARFVAATAYRTDAERFGWSGVFDARAGAWVKKDGATWRHPEGTTTPAAENEPVTQVSWRDAAAYARWAGKRLPTEAEWEYAARGGLVGKRYVWGDDLRPGGRPAANWWQGHFPERNTAEDGFAGRAPVESFRPNAYGLYDMAGNVWEWCADWFGPDYYAESSRDNPGGPDSGEERAMRGGSWLCSENYCTNYRAAARSHATPDTGLNNLGFRCVRDL